MRCDHCDEICCIQWDPVYDERDVVRIDAGDSAAKSIMEHRVSVRTLRYVASGQLLMHLLTNPAKCAIGTGLAVCSELITHPIRPLLLRTHGVPQRGLKAGDDEGPGSSQEILYVVTKREVVLPTNFPVRRREAPPVVACLHESSEKSHLRLLTERLNSAAVGGAPAT